jgi:hypothetical protein
MGLITLLASSRGVPGRARISPKKYQQIRDVLTGPFLSMDVPKFLDEQLNLCRRLLFKDGVYFAGDL